MKVAEPSGPKTDDGRQAGVGEHVLRALGRPEKYHEVQPRRLWGDRFRVNVLVGEDRASARIAHSYFLVVGADGAILEAAPPLVRQYGA